MIYLLLSIVYIISVSINTATGTTATTDTFSEYFLTKKTTAEQNEFLNYVTSMLERDGKKLTENIRKLESVLTENKTGLPNFVNGVNGTNADYLNRIFLGAFATKEEFEKCENLTNNKIRVDFVESTIRSRRGWVNWVGSAKKWLADLVDRTADKPESKPEPEPQPAEAEAQVDIVVKNIDSVIFKGSVNELQTLLVKYKNNGESDLAIAISAAILKSHEPNDAAELENSLDEHVRDKRNVFGFVAEQAAKHGDDFSRAGTAGRRVINVQGAQTGVQLTYKAVGVNIVEASRYQTYNRVAGVSQQIVTDVPGKAPQTLGRAMVMNNQVRLVKLDHLKQQTKVLRAAVANPTSQPAGFPMAELQNYMKFDPHSQKLFKDFNSAERQLVQNAREMSERKAFFDKLGYSYGEVSGRPSVEIDGVYIDMDTALARINKKAEFDEARKQARELAERQDAETQARLRVQQQEKLKEEAQQQEKLRIRQEEAEKARLLRKQQQESLRVQEEEEKARLKVQQEKLRIQQEEELKQARLRLRIQQEETEKARQKLQQEEAEKARQKLQQEEAEKARLLRAQQQEKLRIQQEEAKKQQQLEKLRLQQDEAKKQARLIQEQKEAQLYQGRAFKQNAYDRVSKAEKELEKAQQKAGRAEDLWMMAEDNEPLSEINRLKALFEIEDKKALEVLENFKLVKEAEAKKVALFEEQQKNLAITTRTIPQKEAVESLKNAEKIELTLQETVKNIAREQIIKDVNRMNKIKKNVHKLVEGSYKIVEEGPSVKVVRNDINEKISIHGILEKQEINKAVDEVKDQVRASFDLQKIQQEAIKRKLPVPTKFDHFSYGEFKKYLFNRRHYHKDIARHQNTIEMAHEQKKFLEELKANLLKYDSTSHQEQVIKMIMDRKMAIRETYTTKGIQNEGLIEQQFVNEVYNPAMAKRLELDLAFDGTDKAKNLQSKLGLDFSRIEFNERNMMFSKRKEATEAEKEVVGLEEDIYKLFKRPSGEATERNFNEDIFRKEVLKKVRSEHDQIPQPQKPDYLKTFEDGKGHICKWCKH
eukprot:Pgem_evm1s10478